MFKFLATRRKIRQLIRETGARHQRQLGYNWAQNLHQRGWPSDLIRAHALEFHGPDHIKGALSYLEENQL